MINIYQDEIFDTEDFNILIDINTVLFKKRLLYIVKKRNVLLNKNIVAKLSFDTFSKEEWKGSLNHSKKLRAYQLLEDYSLKLNIDFEILNDILETLDENKLMFLKKKENLNVDEIRILIKSFNKRIIK